MILETNNLSKKYNDEIVLNDVSIKINRNAVYGLLGESGSGKTTLAKIVSGLLLPTSGTFKFLDKTIDPEKQEHIKYLYRHVRIIFQNPETSLNPRMKIVKLLEEPLLIHEKELSKNERLNRIEEILHKVKLQEISPDIYRKNVRELSGGQKRRLAIARAIITKPKLLIADEPTEGLDVSLQGGIIQLFRDIKTTTLLISHNVSVIMALSDHIGVLYKGNLIEEIATKNNSFEELRHPFSAELIDAINDNLKSIQIRNHIDNYDHCFFVPFCKFYQELPEQIRTKCKTKNPDLDIISSRLNHRVRCYGITKSD